MKKITCFIMQQRSKISLLTVSAPVHSQMPSRRFFPVFLLLALVLGACTAPKSPAITPSLATTALPTITLLPEYTSTPTQTATPVNTATPTAVPILPVLNGTPYPQPVESITAADVSRIGQLAIFSTGVGPKDLELSKDKSLLAIVSSAGVRLYNPKTFDQLAFFAPASEYGFVQSVALSSDNAFLATGSEAGAIEVWDVTKHQHLYTFTDGHKEGVQSLAFSPDNRQLVTGGNDAQAKVWDLTTGNLVTTITHRGIVYQVAFSADGRSIFSGSDDETIKMTDVETGKIITTFFDTERVHAMTLTDDGSLLATGSSIWDLASGERLHSLKSGEITDLDFSNDGSQLAISTYDQITVVDVKSGEELHRWDTSADSITFLPDDKLLLSGSSFYGTATIWDVGGDRVSKELNLGQNGVLSVAFSPNGQRAAAGFLFDVIANIWDVNNGELLHALSEDYHGTNCDGVRDLAFSSDSSRLITTASCNFRIVREWDVENGEALQVLDEGGGEQVAYSSDGRFVAWSPYQKVVLWDAVNHQELRAWNPKPDGRFYGVEFSPDGNTLATFSHESSNLQLWDVASGKLVGTLGSYASGIWSAAFSPDGRLIAMGSKDRAQIWDIASGKSTQTLKVPDEYVLDVEFTPSGEMLATAGGIGLFQNRYTKSWQVRFWQVDSGQLIYALPVDINLKSLAFSPDGRMLLTGNTQDGTVRLWGILP